MKSCTAVIDSDKSTVIETLGQSPLENLWKLSRISMGIIYRFGPFVLYPAERELKCDGEPVKLEVREFDLLVFLVKHAPSLAEKKVLLQKVWQDAIVEEGNLSNAICILRKALGCNSKSPIYIQTIPKKGYRFIAEIMKEEPQREADITESRKPGSPFDALLYALPEQGGAELFLNFSRMAVEKLTGPYQDAFLNYIYSDYQGFGMALDYYGRTSASLELELAVNLAFYWDERGCWGEGRERLHHALWHYGEADSELKARALTWLGYMAYHVDDYNGAKQALYEAIRMAGEYEDDFTIALALHGLAGVAEAEGRFADAADLYQKSLLASNRAKIDWITGKTYTGLGTVARALGDYSAAENYYRQGLLKREQAGDKRGVASCYSRLSVVAVAQGDPARARVLLDKSRETIYGSPGKQSVALTQFNLGLIEATSRQYEAALMAFRTSLTLRQEISEKRGVARAMEAMGKIYTLTDNEKEAARMLGGAVALRTLSGAPWSPAELNRYELLTEELHKKFPKEFDDAGKRVLEEIIII